MLRSAKRLPAFLLCATAFLLTTRAGDAAEGDPQIIADIVKVTWVIEESNPPNLVVTAKGKVSHGGFSKAKLSRAVYVMPPSDGIQDYFLTAVPPDGPSTQVISYVEASDRWKGYTTEAPWLKGIRVHGAGDGVVVKMLDDDQDPPGEAAYETFTGESKKGNFQEALDAAIAAAQKALSKGGADIQIAWTLKSTTGVSGGIAPVKTVTVTISAHRK